MLAAHKADEPEPLRSRRSTITPALEAIVRKCLAKRPADRWQSAEELLAQLEAFQAPSGGVTATPAGEATTVSQVIRRPTVAVPAALVLIAMGAAAVWTWNSGAGSRWVRAEAIPQIEMHAEAGEWDAAYALAKKVQDMAPGDPALPELWPRFSWLLTIPSDPAGAKVFRRAYSAANDTWEELGTTPLDRIRFPFGYSLVRFELGGCPPLLRALGFTVEGSQELMRLASFKLDTDESLSHGMVRVPARPETARGVGVPPEFHDFFLGRYEVTNREYEAFVDAGGYQRREWWEHLFVQDGQAIPWEKAMAFFTDKTGRPGPSTWEAGDYPEGQGDYPVGGKDPAAPPKKFGDVGASATDTYSNIYAGWQVVENAAVALEESSDLLMKPGRLCENGRPVPLQRADWATFTQGMREAARAALKAAQSRNRDAAIEVTNQVADACANCHEVYRDKPDVKNRCIP